MKTKLSVEAPRSAAITADGSLIVLSGDSLKRVAKDGKITAFAEGSFPAGYGLTTDAKGNVCLSVRGADQNVKVFSPEGKLTGEIGQARRAGGQWTVR